VLHKKYSIHQAHIHWQSSVADPDLELRGGWRKGDFVLFAMPAFLPFVISSSFTENKGGPTPSGPSPRSASGVNRIMTFQYSELIYLSLHQKLNCLC